MWAILGLSERRGVQLKTHGGVIAQVWRGDGSRQAMLARAMHGVETLPLDYWLGRRAGVLLASTGLSDAVDAALVALCNHGDEIATSEPGDIARLVEASGKRVDVLPV